MAQNTPAGGGGNTKTETIDETDATTQADQSQSTPTLLLRLEQPRDERRVVFHDGVVDNEHMNRKKSKCCCIYKKPLAFGESSSEDDEDCEHCFGHPEKRKKNRKKGDHHDHDHEGDSCPLHRPANEPSTSVQAQPQPPADSTKSPKNKKTTKPPAAPTAPAPAPAAAPPAPEIDEFDTPAYSSDKRSPTEKRKK